MSQPRSFTRAYLAVLLSVAAVLLTVLFATAGKADPYEQLGFVTPHNVTIVPKSEAKKSEQPEGVMKDIPAIKRALESDARRVEA